MRLTVNFLFNRCFFAEFLTVAEVSALRLKAEEAEVEIKIDSEVEVSSKINSIILELSSSSSSIFSSYIVYFFLFIYCIKLF